MDTIVTTIISTLTSGITGMATGIGGGLSALVENIFLAMSDAGAVEGLSTFGYLIVIFAAIGLAVGLSRWVVNWVTSLGASH